MKNKLPIFLLGAALLAMLSCKKNDNNTDTSSSAELETKVIADFTSVLANPTYADLEIKAGILTAAVNTFINNPTDANLVAAQTAWKNTRTPWESCESFLFGPVEDFNYDPTMDSWPVDKNELDSLISSNNNLQVTDLEPLPYTLKGFHAIEYIIFGVGGSQKAANITARQKIYLASLTQSLLNTTTQLKNSWDIAQGNYTNEVITAGKGSTTFATRKDLFIAMVSSMSDICDEVANSKMETPFAAKDSTLNESSFSHNSITDFKNNITGILNVYTCTYKGNSGYGLNKLVAAKNSALDIKLQSQMNAAIASFNTITVSYEKAIYDQQSQVKAVQNTINTLKESLDGDLMDFINANIKD